MGLIPVHWTAGRIDEYLKLYNTYLFWASQNKGAALPADSLASFLHSLRALTWVVTLCTGNI